MKTKQKKKITLVLGGARSGKSSYAGLLVEKSSRNPLYLATAEALDPEMAHRIRQHKAARGPRWTCIEEPLNIARVLNNIPAKTDGVLIDCVTLWLCNVMVKEGKKAFAARKLALVKALGNARCNVVVVGNEVGMGIVPDSRLGRDFRDLAGWLNQDLAKIADDVVFVAAGIPLILKGMKRKR